MRPSFGAAGLGVAVLWGAAGLAMAVPPLPGTPAIERSDPGLEAALAAGLDAGGARPAALPQRVLVLLVDFPDRPHAGDATPARFDSLFFGSRHSLREFYSRSSYGRLQLTGQVTPWLRLPRSLADYANAPREGQGVRGPDPNTARRMVEDAIRAADLDVDFSGFDADGPDGRPASGDDDGLVDALVVVHAGPGSEIGSAGTILSHTWTTVDVVRTADGVGAWRYATVAEDSPLGVSAHEFGHLLGLPDLYDRRSTTRLGGGLGDWSLMASGAWLDGGDTPGDLDAASKLALGFVTGIVPTVNGLALPLAATDGANPGDVYRIWTHGRPDFEYFVVENRQPRFLDAFLPGGGMLVYAVDEHRANNDDLEHPRVRLLQADGFEEIERRINNGDGGDPFPGPRGRLGADTRPSTRTLDGQETQIAFGSITTPTPHMRFDLQLETLPALGLVAQRCSESAPGSNGDGVPEAGEALRLWLRVQNRGLASGPLVLRVRTVPAEAAVWTTGTQPLAPLVKEDTSSVAFVGVAGSALGDPGRLDFAVDVLQDGLLIDSLRSAVGLGTRSGFQACFATPGAPGTEPCASAPWSIESVGGAGTWELTSVAGEFGAVYRSAQGPRYANRADVALVSPPFLLQAGSTLRLLHAYQTQDDAAGFAMDGGRVEIAVDGGAWEGLAPRGGYPRRLQPESVPQLSGAGVFAGSSPRRWDEFDLGTRAGSAQLRCRFASGDSIGDRGWEVARVEVSTGTPGENPPPQVVIACTPNPIRPPGRVQFRIIAPLTSGPQPATLVLYDPAGRRVRRLEHAPVPAESAWFAWDGTDDRGEPVASGMYLARLEWGGMRGTAKVLVLR